MSLHSAMKTPLFVILAAVTIFSIVGCGKRTQPGYHLHGWFSTLPTLQPDDPVMMAGVEIGYVESIAFDPSKAEFRVTMHIQGAAVVKTDSTATIISAPSPGRSVITLDRGSPSAPAANEGTFLKTSEKLSKESGASARSPANQVGTTSPTEPAD